MRKLVAYTLMALDGAVDDPSQIFTPSDDPNEPFLFDSDCEAFELDTISAQDAVLLGRNMYDEWRGFWPGVQDNPFATFINPVQKHVVTSRPLGDGAWPDAQPVSGPLPEIVGRLKSDEGQDIGVHGSIQLVQSLIAENLLDELRLIVGPVVGLPGRRLFENLEKPARMRLTQRDVSSGENLLLTYTRRD